MTPNEFRCVIDELNRFLHPKIATKPEQDGWWEKLKGLDGTLAIKAAKHITDNDTIMPSPGRIKQVIEDLTGTKRMTASEAWSIARPCCSRYVTLDQLNALPPEISKALADAGRASYLGTLSEEQARKAFMGAWNALGDTEHREQVRRIGGGMKQIGG